MEKPPRVLAVIFVLLGAPLGALAEDAEFFPGLPGGGFPSDFGQATIEASRRAVRSRIQDWKEDLAGAERARDAYCLLSDANLFMTLAPASLTLATLQLLPRYVTLSGDDAVPGRVVRPLRDPLTALERQVDLTGEERSALRRLRETEVQDGSDRLRLLIDTQWFLMRLANRLYEDRIAYHLDRTEGFWGFFRADAELCAASALRAERDFKLITAARRVLAFYYFLEREIDSLD